MDAVAMSDAFIGIDLEADEPAARVSLAPLERRFADEVVALRGERDGEVDAGFERVGLVGELITRKDEPRLDPQDVERLEPERLDAVFEAGIPDRVENRERILGMAEDLV